MPSSGVEAQGRAGKQLSGEKRWARALLQLGIPGQKARPWVSGKVNVMGGARAEVGKHKKLRRIHRFQNFHFSSLSFKFFLPYPHINYTII